MRKLTLVLAAAIALGVPTAEAKSGPGGHPFDFKVVVAPPAPRSLAAGQSWNLSVHLYETNGRRWNISGLRPTIILLDVATGRSTTVRLARAAGPSYRGRVVFPHAGTWNLTFDPGVPGFPGKRIGLLSVRSSG